MGEIEETKKLSAQSKLAACEGRGVKQYHLTVPARPLVSK